MAADQGNPAERPVTNEYGDYPIEDEKSEKRSFIQETLNFWQPRTSRKLTEEDARQIIESTSGFLRILSEWRRAEIAKREGGESPEQDVEEPMP